MSDQHRADMADLLGRPQFRRFLWRVIERGGLLTSADLSNLAFAEGRRSMALEILSDAETGQPDPHWSGLPLLASIQTLSDEVQMPQRELETKRGRRRADEYRDLDDGSTGGRDSDGGSDE